MTFSVVARDPLSGELGYAVASCVLAVGAPPVPWIRAGVGVALTQARPVRAYGPRLLDDLTKAATAEQALRAVLADDAEPHTRQLAVLDATGGVAAHTGESCLPESGHLVGDGWSVQGNMLTSPAVLPAMADAMRDRVHASLIERLMAALQAGDAAGGDLRGRQSAAIRVVSGAGADVADGTLTDLRIDDGDDPVGQLRVLCHLRRAYADSDWETLSVFAPAGARNLYAALAAAARGDRAGAREALTALRDRPGWSELLADAVRVGAMPGVRELLDADQLLRPGQPEEPTVP